MRVTDPESLGRLIADVHGLDLEPADIARTRTLAAASLVALAPFVEASLFDTEPAQFEAALDELADGWEPEI